MDTVYLAKVSYGTAELTKVFVERETTKTYQTNGHEDIMGTAYYVSSRLLKSNPTIFPTLSEALSHLIGELDRYIDNKKKKLTRALLDMADCVEMLDEC